jgi:hypothetical protein
MKKFRVLWNPFADEKLQELIAEADEPALISSAADGINRLLVDSAPSYGESREDGVRIAFNTPLGILFEVFEDEHTAVVERVWRTDR